MKSREIAELRSKIIAEIITFFMERDFILADVPEIVSFPGVEVNMDFFMVDDMFLHPSPEIEIKKIIAKFNLEKVFYIGHVFRKGEMDLIHIPEFTMVEWYRQGSDLEEIKKDVILLLTRLIELIMEKGRSVPFSPLSYKEFSIRDIFYKRYGIDLCDSSMEEFEKSAQKLIGIEDIQYSVDDLFFVLWLPIEEELIKENRIFFVKDFPYFVSSLAEIDENCPGVVKRIEFYIAPYEIANGYYELRGSENYKRRFDLLNRIRKEKGYREIEVDKNFLTLMDYYPPSSGIALGVDRLLMAILDVENITDVTYS